MKVRALTNINVGGVWHHAGDVFETDDITGLAGLAKAEQEEQIPAPPAPEPEQKPKKKTSRRKTGG